MPATVEVAELSQFKLRTHGKNATTPSTIQEDVYRPKGAALALFACRAPEVLYEGPAGCGKTRAVGEYVNWLCETYPGSRWLFCRQTRASLSETVMPIFENHVLGPGHPILASGGGPSRTHYQYPNGSRIVLQGLEEPGRTYSSEYDGVAIFEAWEVSFTAWQMLQRACRGKAMGFNQAIAETNPAFPSHWLNRRAQAGKMVRLKGRHRDNPTLTQAYLDRLAGLTGYLRAQLFLGEWVGVSGRVWETFDPNVHIVDEVPIEGMKWFFGAMDWGWRDTGVFQVWGVETGATRDMDRMYMLAEIYQPGRLLDWWAEAVAELDLEFGLQSIVCDPSRPENVVKLNDMIGSHRGRHMGRIARRPSVAIGANNKRRARDDLAGLDLVRWALDPAQDGGPRVFFLRDALRYPRPERFLEEGRPTCTVEEIESYVFAEPDGEAHGKAAEETDPDCWDDGCDTLRYACNFMWRRNLAKGERPQPWEPGSAGDVLGIPRHLNT